MAVLAAGTSLRAEKLVTVRAVADSGYVRRRADNSGKPETYVFVKGQHFRGMTFDTSLERMTFSRIAQTLAADLKEQRFEPAKEIGSADLVLVVHWGVTIKHEKAAQLFITETDGVRQGFEAIETARQAELQDVSGVSSALGLVAAAEASFHSTAMELASMHSGNSAHAASNAELLGFKAALANADEELFESDLTHTLRTMVEEERYFIIVMAYDGPSMRQGKKRRLWTSRFSIRSAGVNFGIALDRMSSIGGKFFGTSQPSLSLQRTKDRTGTVKVGDLKVIGDSP